uniref:Cytochrome b5 heme-binding domain-containing protein n=1 Tax=Strix occidentalis caurina TaxID=311401 RepID=A0A8D0EZZ0_STROC
MALPAPHGSVLRRTAQHWLCHTVRHSGALHHIPFQGSATELQTGRCRRTVTLNRQAAALPWMKPRDSSMEELRAFDGARNPRILLPVNGKVFDVTKGSKFYGPEAPYGIFAGRDASRRLATFCLHEDALRDEYDDLSELNALQIQSDYVGRLLKPGQEPSEYTDEEIVANEP